MLIMLVKFVKLSFLQVRSDRDTKQARTAHKQEKTPANKQAIKQANKHKQQTPNTKHKTNSIKQASRQNKTQQANKKKLQTKTNRNINKTTHTNRNTNTCV